MSYVRGLLFHCDWLSYYTINKQKGTICSIGYPLGISGVPARGLIVYFPSFVDDVPSFDWMRKISVKKLSRNESKGKVSLVFENLSAEDLAIHLSYLDYKACRRISVSSITNPLGGII